MGVADRSFFFVEPIDVLRSWGKLPVGACEFVDQQIRIAGFGERWRRNGGVPGGVGHGELARRRFPIYVTKKRLTYGTLFTRVKTENCVPQ